MVPYRNHDMTRNRITPEEEMRAALPFKIELSESEQRLYDRIDFSAYPGSESALAAGKSSHELMDSLIKRDAVPAIRWSYFAEPFPDGRGKSILKYFQSNPRGTHVFEDTNFVHHYLRYFIYGPNLPRRTMEQFCQIVRDDIDLRERLCRFVREEVHNADFLRRTDLQVEFYRLALECIPDDHALALSIREAAIQAR